MTTRTCCGTALLLSMLAALPGRAATPAPAEDADARIARWDKGPATIDVTNYPAVARESYNVFAARCARCHPASRAINADYVLPEQWSSCVGRMADKWFSGINKAASRNIREFLVYDSSVRKKPQVDAALAKLSAEARKTAEAAIAEIRLRFEKP